MGVIALTCAAIDDVTAWCLLAFVVSRGAGTRVGRVHHRSSARSATSRPWCSSRGRRWCACRVLYGSARAAHARRDGARVRGAAAVVMATDAIGIHAIFGAFALGAVIPHDSGLARELTDRLEDLVVVLLLPASSPSPACARRSGSSPPAPTWLCAALIIARRFAGQIRRLARGGAAHRAWAGATLRRSECS